MYTEEFEVEYFENLAKSLVDLNHSSSKPHFFFNLETGSGLTEIQNAMRGQLFTPCMILDESELDSDGTNSQKLNLNGGFTILESFTPSNVKQMREARSKAKRIARKIINKMRRDSIIQYGEESALLSSHAIQIGEIKQYPSPIILNTLLGWCVEFTWIIPADLSYGKDDFV